MGCRLHVPDYLSKQQFEEKLPLNPRGGTRTGPCTVRKMYRTFCPSFPLFSGIDDSFILEKCPFQPSAVQFRPAETQEGPLNRLNEGALALTPRSEATVTGRSWVLHLPSCPQHAEATMPRLERASIVEAQAVHPCARLKPHPNRSSRLR